MTTDEFLHLIYFKEQPSSITGVTSITGRFELTYTLNVDSEELPEALEYCKKVIRARMLRTLYEDQRKELYKAVLDLLKAGSMDFMNQAMARDKILTIAQYQPPREALKSFEVCSPSSAT